MAPTASIVIPTRSRPRYLEVTLASIAPQAAAAGVEVIVVDDGGGIREVQEIALRFGARYEAHPRPLGPNAARNTGIERSGGELIVFVDDDVQVREGWLEALLGAAQAHPDVDVLAGPIIASLEGSPPRSCGREGPPITSLDLGCQDTEAVRFAWSANMAVRRSAFDRVGPFDPAVPIGGDEQEWQERLQASGSAKTLYVAAAALDHRRSPEDSRLWPLMRSCHHRGRASRRFDVRRGRTPSRMREAATLLACLGHVVRYRCPNGLTMAAHSAGRLRQALAEHREQGGALAGRLPEPAGAGETDDFLSGESGTVGGLDGVRRELADRLDGALELMGGRRRRLGHAASRHPAAARRVLVLGVRRPERGALADALCAELRRSRHEVELHMRPPGGLGKFENLNELLAEHPAGGHDWLLVVDDDIELPNGFLDRFIFLAERFSLDLAQPAHLRASHAAWRVTRRVPGSVVRETRFVEIGPLTAFSSSTFSTLLPFPPLKMGWGLDVHWAALAQREQWRIGVVDAVPIRHRFAPAADAYSRQAAIAEARAFLAERPHLSASEAQRTLATHRRW